MKILKTASYKKANWGKKYQESATIESNGKMLDVVFDYAPGYAGSFYRSNGDPGDPAEDPEVDVISVTDSMTKQIISDEILDSQYDIVDIINKCVQAMEDKRGKEIDDSFEGFDYESPVDPGTNGINPFQSSKETHLQFE